MKIVNNVIEWLKWLRLFERSCLSVHHVAIMVAISETVMPISTPASQQDWLTKSSLQVNSMCVSKDVVK
jgi:hypothetical protein